VIGDTICALASPPGAAQRAVLRISGPAALRAAALVFAPAPLAVRATLPGAVAVLGRQVTAFALVMPAPGSFTGEDVVELHVPGSPLLVQLLQEELLRRGSDLGLRLALPGEFTRRAFEHGRLGLAEAEGLLALIHGAGETERRRALALLRGGLSASVRDLRALLQEGLAQLEAGLDFTADETGGPVWRPVVEHALEQVAALLGALPRGRMGGEVLLLGRANAGKSSLCNALAGRRAVLVDREPGTTRDVVRVEIGGGLALWDAPGDLAQPEEQDRAALALRDRVGADAAAVVLVVDPRAGASGVVPPALPVLAMVATHADLPGPPACPPPGVPLFTVSNVTGAGLSVLREFLGRRCAAGVRDLGGPQRAALELCRDAISRALGAGAMGPELVAVDLRQALETLDAIDGRHCSEDLLDRIFARFCLGK
jgi:tRNA modification GTPase